MSTITPYCGNQPYIFISYANRDKARVMPVITRLSAEGLRVWYDEGIDPGTEWEDNIAGHLVGCEVFISFMSENYIRSDNCKDELSYARDLGKSRLVVYLEPVDLPPGIAMRINRLQAIHKHRYDSDSAFYSKLMETPFFDKCRGSQPGSTPPPDPSFAAASPLHSLSGFSGLKPIGRGAGTMVYRSHDTVNDREVTIKQFTLNSAFNCPLFSNYELYMKLIRVSSPYLSRLYDVSRNSPPCIIKQYIDGVTLRRYLNGRRIPLREALTITVQMLQGLTALHDSGIYCGDMSLDNVVISTEGRATLCDFSCSNFFGAPSDGETMIYNRYVSPERYAGKPLDQRSDLYETGILLDEMTFMSVQMPEGSIRPSVIRLPLSECMSTAIWSDDDIRRGNVTHDIMGELYRIIEKATQHDAAQRYQTAAQMSSDLTALMVRMSNR